MYSGTFKVFESSDCSCSFKLRKHLYYVPVCVMLLTIFCFFPKEHKKYSGTVL